MSIRQRVAGKRKNSRATTAPVDNEPNQLSPSSSKRTNAKTTTENEANPASELSPSSSKRKSARTTSDNEANQLSPTSSKRQKVVPEKRLRRYRQTMSSAIRDRIERALHQRLYLLAATKSSNEIVSREYKVLGNTANVYTVIITHVPSCSCPDYAKGHLCKHIIFVLHRVLKVSRSSPLLYQQALVTDELNEIFSKADAQYNGSYILAEQSIREAYHAKTGDPDVIINPKTIQQKTITNEDECPICYESMINDKNNVIFCSKSCGNNMHKNCFEQWRQAKVSMRESVTCPFCRVEWKADTKTSNTNPSSYLNLAAYSTTHEYDEDEDDDDDDDEDDYMNNWMFFRYRYY
ncbi:unnamed protein product [Rotaria magnacalcarata]|uniref:Uncharacterized protein n=3 Tax=Rotaria magnacalcarata TaxID=392030 RepID=A0A815C0A3_9BILA|nr:unnamed protein product [Rotaria magnacalcarata]CAF4080213.1 unnamed protein product [Rotaria magnacalcarata]